VALRQRAARFGFVRVALAGGVALVAAQSLGHLLATFGFGSCDGIEFGTCSSPFDLDRSNGLPDVGSTVVIAAATLGAGVLAARNRAARVPAALLALALLLVGTDDALHARDNASSSFGIVVIATLVASFTLAAWVASLVPRVASLCLGAGVALLALDVKMPFAYDQLMNVVGQPWLGRGDVLKELGIVLDEAMELFGWVLVTTGLWEAALTAQPVLTHGQPDFALDTALERRTRPRGTGTGRATR
jgi:hypothetical protein